MKRFGVHCNSAVQRNLNLRSCIAAALLLLVASAAAAQTQALKSNNIKQVLIGEGKGQYEFNPRNVSQKQAFRMVQHEGRIAAEITLSKSMSGHKDDWNRGGRPGYAQRFEYGQKKNSATKRGRTVWTHMLFWLPPGTTSDQTTHLFDLKEVRNGKTFGPLVSFSVRNDGGGSAIKLTHRFDKFDCVDGIDTSGTKNSFCDTTDTNVIFGPVSRFSGRWVQVVLRVVWDGPSKGVFDMWLDGRKVVGYQGNTAHSADSVRFKFGVYRLKLNSSNNPPDFRAYFSYVGNASSCSRLGLSTCAAMEAQKGPTGYTNVSRVFRVNSKGKSDFIASGGRVLK